MTITNEKPLTTIISVKCTDGVVIGVDSTFQNPSQKKSMKVDSKNFERLVYNKDRNIIASISGDEPFGIRFNRVVMESKLDIPEGNDKVTNSMNQLLISEGFGKPPFHMGTSNFVGYIDNKGEIQCAEFNENFVSVKMSEEEWFKVAGTGKVQTLPIMKFFANTLSPFDIPNVKMASILVYWILKQAINSNQYLLCGPIKLATIVRESSGTIKTQYYDFDKIDVKAEFDAHIANAYNAWTQLNKEFLSTPNFA